MRNIILFCLLLCFAFSTDAQKLYEIFDFKGDVSPVDTNSISKNIKTDIRKRMAEFVTDLDGLELYAYDDSAKNLGLDYGLGIKFVYNSQGKWIETKTPVDIETAQKMQDKAIDMKYEVQAYGNPMGNYQYTNTAGSWYTCWVQKFNDERSIYNGYTLIFSTKFNFIKAVPDKDNIE